MDVIFETKSLAGGSATCPTLAGTALPPPSHLFLSWLNSTTDPMEPVFSSSSSSSLPLRPADEPSREPNPSAELTCTSLASKGGRDPGANGPVAKPAGQDAPSAVANFLYGVSLPTPIAVDLKQEVSCGANAAGEALLPRPAGELKVPSSQEYSDCCGNSLEFALSRGPGAKPTPAPGAGRGQAGVFWRSSDENRCKAWSVWR